MRNEILSYEGQEIFKHLERDGGGIVALEVLQVLAMM
jgi:hypothetical protein